MVKEIGKLLRETREKRGITLEEISRQTKIQEKYLKHLEEGNFEVFAGDVYVKGALRNYAEAIGLNAAEIVKLYVEATRQYKILEGNKDNVEKIEKKKGPIGFISRGKKPLPVVALIWIILLVLVVSGSIWYRYRQASNNQLITLQENNYILDEEEEREEEKGETNNEILIEEEPQKEPELLLVSRNEREIVYVLKGVTHKNIIINFTDRCWVRIVQDGRLIEEKNYSRDSSTRLGDSFETIIRLGYPRAASIVVNGFDINNISQLSSPVNIIIRKEE